MPFFTNWESRFGSNTLLYMLDTGTCITLRFRARRSPDTCDGLSTSLPHPTTLDANA
jgi:hypothetical protein